VPIEAVSAMGRGGGKATGARLQGKTKGRYGQGCKKEGRTGKNNSLLG